MLPFRDHNPSGSTPYVTIALIAVNVLVFVSEAGRSLAVPRMGGVAWWAHIGGFVLGMALLPLFQKPPQKRRGYAYYR